MYGYCKCGCGQKTRIADQSFTRLGWVKGEPISYVRFHQNRGRKYNGALNGYHGFGNGNNNYKGGKNINSNGYARILMTSHPRASSNGYVLEHIVIVEKVLGRFLRGKEEVHHVNGIKNDNRHENLVLCENRSYHMLLHKTERITTNGLR